MSESNAKKVSVIVPNYNYGKYLRKRIGSILAQTYPIYELIILDDASTDGSAELAKNIVLDLKLKNPEMRVKFVGNKENSGKAITQWKKGIEEAKGDYVWIAEADDLCSKQFLEEAIKGFDDPNVVLSYTESKIINGMGMVIAPNFRWSRDKEKTGHYKHSYVKDGRDEIREIMAIRCTIPNVSAVIFRKDAVKKKDLEEAIKFLQVGDWYLYTKLLEGGKIVYNREALNKFRVHGGSKTAGSKKDDEHYREIIKMHKYFENNYDLSKEVKKAIAIEEKRIKERCETIG